MDYEDRFVAYVDIWGFKKLIERSVGPCRLISPEQIKEILEWAKPAGTDQIVLGDIGDISESGHIMTQFSDCVVITVSKTKQGIMHLLHHVARIGYRLFRFQIICRGGITRGDVYHDGQVIFGPAMNEAYRLEQKCAKYPRVILSEDVVRDALSADPNAKQFILRDDDGYHFVNTLWVLRKYMDFESGPPDYIKRLCIEFEKHLIKEMQDSLSEDNQKKEGEQKELSLFEKYKWVTKYFDWVRDRSWMDIMNQPYPANKMGFDL